MPSWYSLLVIAIGCAVLLLQITLIRRTRESKELVNLHRELDTAHQTIAELQAKLVTIEDRQPRLKAEAIVVRRKLAYEQHPHVSTRGGLGSFALLRITNDPESKSRHAVAGELRAKIAYYDTTNKEVFPSIDGTWGSPDHEHHYGSIGDFYAAVSILRPQESTYLGIALRYPWGPPSECYAFNGFSRKHPDWLHPEWRLSGETIYVKVLIVGHGIKETYTYKMKNCGPADGLQLEEVSSPS